MTNGPEGLLSFRPVRHSWLPRSRSLPSQRRYLFAASLSNEKKCRLRKSQCLPRWLGQQKRAPRREFSMARPLISCLLVGPSPPGKSTWRFRSIRQDGLVRQDVIRARNLAPLLEDEL